MLPQELVDGNGVPTVAVLGGLAALLVVLLVMNSVAIVLRNKFERTQ
jgi:hypothetical protein